MPETESIDRLYLELSQFTKAKTAREIALEGLIKRAWEFLNRLDDSDFLSPTAAQDCARLKAMLLHDLKAGER